MTNLVLNFYQEYNELTGLEIHVLAGIIHGNTWLRQPKGEDKMDGSEIIKYVVKALTGTELRREHTMNPKTMNDEENVILQLPFRTIVMVEGDDSHQDADGSTWMFVRLEKEADKQGWVDFSCLASEFISMSKVTALQGTDLRREPTLEAKGEDGSDNVIRLLPVNTKLLLVDFKRYDDGSFWFFVSPEIDNNEEVGWVVMEDIEAPPFGGDNQGHLEATYTFKYPDPNSGTKYTITQKNLDTALAAGYKYFSETKFEKLTDTQFQIELQRNLAYPKNTKTKYWTTATNLKNVTVDPDIS